MIGRLIAGMERDPRMETETGERPARLSNRLAHEKSPYLLQHAENPVDWYPWGSEAFLRAAREDKPIFLSIGYATCHWCHVMAHESFEDDEVAGLLNRDFVCIKVDREERPDIDSVYMSVCQMMTGQGGWPLTIIMTHEKKPFFAATYLPKERRFSVYGLLDLLPRIVKAWHGQRTELMASSNRILGALTGMDRAISGGDLDPALPDDGYEELVLRFDPDYGGFGRTPKFPTPHLLLFLLRYWRRTKKTRALEMVTKTLDALRDGGIHDHIGGGFHRYATDAQWRVPHFEKMLYDQALLLMAYTEAFQATGYSRYRKTAEEIIGYVIRDLTSADGAFFSAEDADSPGGEGAYYLWSMSALISVLGPEEAALAARVFSVREAGNFAGTGDDLGQNILYRTVPLSSIAASLDMTVEDLESRILRILERLCLARQGRPRPSCDDKVLADWNGLFIAALARAARVFGSGVYRAAAERAMAFVLTRLCTGQGQLLHRYRDGEAAIPAFADDYAFTILALLELYETSFEDRYLSKALRLTGVFNAQFLDTEHGGYFSVTNDGEVLFIRKKEVYDGAVPSANSVACENLLRLYSLTGDHAHEQKALSLIRSFSQLVQQNPAACGWFLCALLRVTGATQEIVIAGKAGEADTEQMIAVVRERYLPENSVLFRSTSDPAPVLISLAPFTRDMTRREGKATAYVCSGNACAEPVTDPDVLAGMLDQEKKDA